MSRCSIALIALLLALPTLAKDPFADYIRTTEPLSADEELKTFKLPDGFQIQLVAAEPDIGKPMNLAFDARGRAVGDRNPALFRSPRRTRRRRRTASRFWKTPTATGAPTRSPPSPTI